jgi:hypothetical protein
MKNNNRYEDYEDINAKDLDKWVDEDIDDDD